MRGYYDENLLIADVVGGFWVRVYAEGRRSNRLPIRWGELRAVCARAWHPTASIR